MLLIFGVGSVAAEAAMVWARLVGAVKFDASWRTAACVLEKAKLYMVVLVSLISLKASLREVLLSWSMVSLKRRIAWR